VIVHEGERLDFSKVPQSRGIPPMLYRLVVIGIVGIFAVGFAVVWNAPFGHHWPANTTLRAPLVNSNNP
jgi:ABC-type transporter Mla subunit MlaD